ncbi:hypothetical protein [Phocaeicola plebeius]
MKPLCREYVRPAQIDTLRSLLTDKETHLRHIMEVMERQDEANSLLVNHLPEVARRATRVRTVRKKKSGLAGFFGGKKTVQVLPSAGELHAFSDSLTALQRKQAAEMEAYADSLRIRNRTLNRELGRLIRDLDTQAQAAFDAREQDISEAQALSVRLLTATISAAIVLLFLSGLAIHREIRRKPVIECRVWNIVANAERVDGNSIGLTLGFVEEPQSFKIFFAKHNLSSFKFSTKVCERDMLVNTPILEAYIHLRLFANAWNQWFAKTMTGRSEHSENSFYTGLLQHSFNGTLIYRFAVVLSYWFTTAKLQIIASAFARIASLYFFCCVEMGLAYIYMPSERRRISSIVSGFL